MQRMIDSVTKIRDERWFSKKIVVLLSEQLNLIIISGVWLRGLACRKVDVREQAAQQVSVRLQTLPLH